MKYTASILALAVAASAQDFTSIYNITATPNQVVNASSLPAPGQPGATGQFNYAINSRTNTICYDITLFNVDGTYQSPALTATHIHEAAVGRNGPPRIAFPNPVSQGSDAVRRSVGCLTGPFTTGIRMADNVTDTGAGFNVAQIEANPAGFFTDSHTNLYVPGVVRGQLNQSFRLLTSNGSAITTATLTATQVVTISRCATTVVSCPFTTAPVMTTTVSVYTTVCPVSALTTLPGYISTPAAASTPAANTGAAASSSRSGVNVVTQISDGQIQATGSATQRASSMTSVRPSSTVAASASTTSRPVTQFTGAANVNAVGGGIVAAAVLVAGALL